MPNTERSDAYFGLCPKCGEPGVNINIGRENWFVCHDDETKWLGGVNLFSTWSEFRERAEASVIEDELLLDTYTQVEPNHLRLVKE